VKEGNPFYLPSTKRRTGLRAAALFMYNSPLQTTHYATVLMRLCGSVAKTGRLMPTVFNVIMMESRV